MAAIDDYRRLAAECLAIARTTTNPNVRAVLVHLAEVWNKLANERANQSDDTSAITATPTD
jgi:hypothetical protein